MVQPRIHHRRAEGLYQRRMGGPILLRRFLRGSGKFFFASSSNRGPFSVSGPGGTTLPLVWKEPCDPLTRPASSPAFAALRRTRCSSLCAYALSRADWDTAVFVRPARSRHRLRLPKIRQRSPRRLSGSRHGIHQGNGTGAFSDTSEKYCR